MVAPAKLHNMPEDYTSPPPPPITPSSAPYGQIPPYGSPYSAQPGYGGIPPRRRSPWFYIGIIGGSLAAVVLVMSLMVWGTMRSLDDDSAGFGVGSGRIAVIDVSGVILSPETVDSQLRKFGDDSSVKAILLHINSPGGGAAASQEIYHEVLRVGSRVTKRSSPRSSRSAPQGRTTLRAPATEFTRTMPLLLDRSASLWNGPTTAICFAGRS